MKTKNGIDKWINKATHKAPRVGEVIRVVIGSVVRQGRVLQTRLVTPTQAEVGVQWLDDAPMLKVAA